MPKFYSHFILHQTTLPLYDRPREGFCPLFSKSKIVCADSSRRSPTMCAMWTPLCGRKKGSCVLSSTKISTLFRISEIFQQQKNRFLSNRQHYTENKRTFSRKRPCSFHILPLFCKRRAGFLRLCLSSSLRARESRHTRTRPRASRTYSSWQFLPSPFTFAPNALILYDLQVKEERVLTLHR